MLTGKYIAMYDLSRKNALITGAGSGIGASIARLFAKQGAHVHALEFNKENGQAVVDELTGQNYAASLHVCDVSNATQVYETIQAISQDYDIDILVNNAGVAHVGNIENTTEEDFQRLFDINVKGVFNCSKAVIPYMKSGKGGVILNMASIASTVGIPDRFAYSMTKGAVLTMTYSIARDYLNDNIRCNSLAPARVHTPFVDGFIKQNYPGKEDEMFEKLSKTQPIGRMGKTDEIAHLALYLCSEEAGFITGSNFPIDGGFVTLNT